MTTTESTPDGAGFLDPQNLKCPFGFYQRMHDQLPVAHVPGPGFHLVSRYDDVMEVLRDDSTYSSEVAAKMTSGLSMNPPRDSVNAVLAQGYPHVDSLAWLDPPRHTRQRAMITKAFSPRRVKQLEDEIRRTAEELVAAWPDHGVVDAVASFALPLPVAVIGAALGVEHEQLGQLARWSDAVLNRLGKVLTEEEDVAEARLVVELQHFLAGLVEERRTGGRDDLLADLVTASLDDGEPLALPELISLILTIMVAGNDTTRGLISSLLSELVRRPELLRKVRDDRTLIPIAIDETLRLQCPTTLFTRLTTKDVEIRGTKIPAGELVMVMFHAANVDAAQFPDPLDFRLDRENGKSHLGFGFGIHYCPGGVLAKREAEIALNVLLDRFTDIRLATADEPDYEPNFQIRKLASLNLEVTG